MSMIAYVVWFVCVQNAAALVNGIPLASLQQQHADAMRRYVLTYLLRVAQPPAEERIRCDGLDCAQQRRSRSQQQWVCCDVCGRWLHFVCVGIARKPRGAYVCLICQAQYD